MLLLLEIELKFKSINKWFRLSLNFNETHFIKFPSKNSPQIDLDISYAGIVSAECNEK